MQSKVSMVMPCYNKVEYIKEMFDSIIAQKWDNIELILVNDGSTDGTREVISEYVPKFLSRGFEAVVLDQENAGVCAAAKAGLLRVTGDYVCMVDADDELDPEYVSTMAEWLDTHSDCDFCVCDAVEYTGGGGGKEFRPFSPRGPEEQDPKHLERYMLLDIRPEVWVYLVRADYLNRCRIPETYYTDTPGSHEPGFIIPLLANGGKYKYFSLPLYRLNVGCAGHSRPESLKKRLAFFAEYRRLRELALDKVPESLLGETAKKRLLNLAVITKCIDSIEHINALKGDAEIRASHAAEMAATVNDCFSGVTHISGEQLENVEIGIFPYLKRKLLGIGRNRRIIGYGALGRRAVKLLPLLNGTALEPDELWDAAGDGTDVKKPDFDSLNKDDLLLIFPKSEELYNEIKARAACRVMPWWDLQSGIAFELMLKMKPSAVHAGAARPESADAKIKMLVINQSLFRYAGIERFLLNFLEIFPEDKYQIDLQLLDCTQNESKMLELVPKHVNILPPLMMPEAWRTIGDWTILRHICPVFMGYDHVVSASNGNILKMVAVKTAGAIKTAFVHFDYKTSISAGCEDESAFLSTQVDYGQMDNIIVLTEQNIPAFCELFPELAPKVRLLPHVTHVEPLLRASEAFYPCEYKKGKFNILTAARIHPQKGIICLLKAAKKLKDCGADFCWFIVGSFHDDEYSERCCILHAQLGLNAEVVFLGEKTNPYPYYRHCDLYVQPSLFEGRGLSVEEARILNRPIVATDYPSVHDQITDGVNGRISPQNPDALSEIICELYRDEAQRERLAAANSDYFGEPGKEKYFDIFR